MAHGVGTHGVLGSPGRAPFDVYRPQELIVWLVQNFGDRFDEVDYADTFKQASAGLRRGGAQRSLAAAWAPLGAGGRAGAAHSPAH